jgi:hypothetical protein
MFRLFAVALLAALSPAIAPTPAQAQTPAATCALHGRIADTEGAAISRAFVLVHSERWIGTDQHLTLNENGEFQAQLKPGLYDFFAASRGFLPFAKEIDLRACKPLDLKIKMKVDLEHLED